MLSEDISPNLDKWPRSLPGHDSSPRGPRVLQQQQIFVGRTIFVNLSQGIYPAQELELLKITEESHNV